MTGRLDRYHRVGVRLVPGWLRPEMLTVLTQIDAVQRTIGVTGAVAEIGVHRGKLFIALHLLQQAGESAVAVDVFGEQNLNVDHSGRGDQAKFLANLDRWSSRRGVVVHQGDSTVLAADELLRLAGDRIRMFSVDGGHTEQIVLSDMRLAEQVLADGGVVIADDVFNGDWPGVAVGTLRYLDQGAELVPFLIGFNKTLFAAPRYCAQYRAAVESAFATAILVDVTSAAYNGHAVTVLRRVPRTPIEVLRVLPPVAALRRRRAAGRP